jgi:hypothetical protein
MRQIALLLVACSAVALCGSPVRAAGQEQAATSRIGAAEALARFRADALAGVPDRTLGMSALAKILLHREQFGSAAVDTVLRGLEQFAAGHNPEARPAVAFLVLAGAWLNDQPDAVLPRLIRTYDASDNPDVRILALNGAARQPDREGAAAFLARIASEATPRFPEEPWNAVAALTRMGPVGRRALEQLHGTRAVRQTKARSYLEHLASRGYSPEQ